MYKFVITSVLAASSYAAPIQSATLAPRVDYRQFNGDGSAAQGWPTIEQWQSWDQLWATNSALMAHSCGWNGWGADNSAQETSDVGNAIQSVAGSNGLDARYVLAVVMQESKGCVRVPTTNNGVVNPGLMQSHNGAGSCAGVNPCPYSTIYQMVTDGTAGTPYGDGLKQTVASTGESGAQGMYAGARKYNSGSVNLSDLGQSFGSTASYASDIANRVIGWAA